MGYRTACVYSGGFKKKKNLFGCAGSCLLHVASCVAGRRILLAAHGLSCPVACGILVP